MACRRLCCALALLLAFCLWLTPEASALPSSFDVLDYNSVIEIETDGDITVTEDITIYVPTSGTNKGIIRDIPVNPRWHELGRQAVKLTVEEVSINGKPCPTNDLESTYPVLSVYMRDKASYLDAGEHRFRLRFRMSEQVGFFEEGDELTWNAVGEGWSGGVHRARAIVLPPQGTEFTQERAWLGTRGSHDSPVRIHRKRIGERKALVFEANRPIRHGEAFTVAVGWPSGIVEAPAVVGPEDQWGFTLLYAALCLGSFLGAWKLWVRYGRDPQTGAVIPLFYPPKVPQRLRTTSGDNATEPKGKARRLLHGEEYMTPVAVHYVHENGELGARGLAALFLSLAQRGDCRLRGSASKNVVVEKIGSSSPAPEENAAAKKLPERLTLTPNKSIRNPIGDIYNACKLRLDFDYSMEVEWNIWPQLLLWLAMAAAIALSALCQLGDNFSELVMEKLGELAGGLGALLLGVAGAAYLIYDAVKNKTFSFRLIGFEGFCLFIAYTGCLMLLDVDVLWIFSPLQLGLMIATLLPPIGFFFLMDLPSREQVELKREIDGLALYIGTAETERFNLLNPPEENLQLYHRLLPYAVALGLEDAWGKRFADKLSSALADEEFFTTSFTDDLLRHTRISFNTYREAAFAAQAAKYASSSGGGSSFGGFGGGAGSGGGGGGGRAC